MKIVFGEIGSKRWPDHLGSMTSGLIKWPMFMTQITMFGWALIYVTWEHELLHGYQVTSPCMKVHFSGFYWVCFWKSDNVQFSRKRYSISTFPGSSVSLPEMSTLFYPTVNIFSWGFSHISTCDIHLALSIKKHHSLLSMRLSLLLSFPNIHIWVPSSILSQNPFLQRKVMNRDARTSCPSSSLSSTAPPGIVW